MAEVDNQTEWLEQEVALSREELIHHLHRVLSDTLFSNRAYVRPADIKPIAVTEADTFLAFLRQPNREAVLTHGAALCQLGLGSQAMLRLGQVIRQFCLNCSVDNLNLSTLEIGEAYHIALMQGFTQTHEDIIFEEQERIRSALQRTLNTYTVQMKLAADIANITSSILDLNELLRTSVELIRQRLDFYYVGLFLLDEYNRWAILRAGTGQIGWEMLGQNYKVKVEDTSPIGWCLIHSQPRVVQRKREATTGDSPTLLETYSEALLPLISRGQVIGAVTIQSQHGKRFSEQDITVLSIIVDQVASAIQNARLFAQAQTNLENLQTIQRHYLREAWAEPVPQQLAYRYQQSTDTFALVENVWHPATEQAVRDNQPIVVTDGAVSPDHSILAIPIALRGQVIGAIDLYDASESKTWSQDEINLATTIASQAALSLENARLLQETQIALNETKQALAEMELLYQISMQLNAATDLDQVLQVIAWPEVAPNLSSAALFLFDSERQEWSEYAELAAAIAHDDASNDLFSLPIGTRLALTEFPLIKLWLSGPDEPLLISHVAKDDRIDPETRTLCRQANAQAIAIIPLKLGENWMGVASMVWVEAREFSERDIRLYGSIADQAAIVVNNWLLLRQAEMRAVQLEKLLQTEAALSKAETDEEILTALVPAIEETVCRVTLSYIDEDEQGQPATITTVSSWRNKAIWLDDPILGLAFTDDDFPFMKLLRDTSDRVILVDDVETDERLDTFTRKIIRQLDIRTAAILPLRSRDFWQGVVIFSWEEAHRLSANERLMFEQLLEPVAAVVASRRAYMAQQAALTEIERLYDTVRRLNEANTLQEVVVAVAAGLSIPVINRIVLAIFEEDLIGKAETMMVSASWYGGNGPAPLPVGTYYPREIFNLIQAPAMPTSLFFDDIQRDERIDPAAIVALIGLNILAMAALPLWVGGRQLGVLLLESDETHHFTNSEVRFYTSLAQQMAVTIDNQRLLVETQAALAEVEATQRRYTLQAWEAYQVKAAIKRYEQVRDGELFLKNKLPAAISQAVENKQTLISKSFQSNSEQGQIGSDNGQTPSEKCQAIIAPLTVRDEVIGVLGLQETDEEREWLPEEVALVETIAKEIAQAAENLRLLDETQQRAAREKKVNEISEKIQAAPSLEDALRIAVKEVGLSLQAPQTTVELKVK